MLRSALVAFAAATLSTSLVAQNQSYAGNWTMTASNGNVIQLQLAQDARGQVTGTLSGNGTVLQVQGQLQQGRVVAQARNQQGAVSLQAQLVNGSLSVALAEVGPDGQAGPAQQLVMTRAGGNAMGQLMGGQQGAPQQMSPQPTSAQGDPFVGTFHGQDLSIQLQRSGQGYSGTARSGGGQYPIQARVANGIMSGSYTDRGQQRTFQAAVQGDVMQLEADGTQFMLQRQGGGQGQMGAQQGQMSAPPQQMQGGQMGAAGAAGALASTPQDQQIAQLLLSSRWCSFAYSQVSGRTSTEQVQFFPDGTVSQGAQSETQSSNPNGSYYGNSSGGQRGRWRVQNNMLMLSQDGGQWAPTPLQITRNSNGYPIVTAGGKEYSQCN